MPVPVLPTDPTERMLAKTQRILDAVPSLPYSWTGSGITYTVHEMSIDGLALAMTVTASDVNGSLGIDNSYRFVNPPQLAPHPGGDILIGGRKYRDSPLEAMKLMVTDAIHQASRR